MRRARCSRSPGRSSAAIHPFAPESSGGIHGALRVARVLAGGDHRLRRRQPAAQRRLPGRVCGPDVDQGLPRTPWRPNRDVCLIPLSAHGTNPASAVMAGMTVVPVKCDDRATSTSTTSRPMRANTGSARRDHDHLPLDPRRVRRPSPDDLRSRARARRAWSTWTART